MIDVIADASVALKWFHSAGEEEVEASRALLDAHRARVLAVGVLDLTAYEVGNALLRVGASEDAVGTVLGALAEIVPVHRPNADELALAARLAQRQGLTLCDGSYAAAASALGARLVTLDGALSGAGLGMRPSEAVREAGLTPATPNATRRPGAAAQGTRLQRPSSSGRATR